MAGVVLLWLSVGACSGAGGKGGALGSADVGEDVAVLVVGDVGGISSGTGDGGIASDVPGPSDAAHPEDTGSVADVGAVDVAAAQDGVVATDVPAGACLEGALRCVGNGAFQCSAGAWELLQDCGTATCVDGACACVPDCAGRSCGPDGCGGSCGVCESGVCHDADGTCEPVGAPVVYSAVYVEDRWGGTCSGSSSSGADILGAELHDGDGVLVGYWDAVVADVGTDGCQNSYTDASVTVGEPTQSQLSLQGGWVAGTFPGKNAIGPGFTFTVYEFGSNMGGSDESYAVYLATDLECPKSPNAKTNCLKLVSEDGYGPATFVVPGE